MITKDGECVQVDCWECLFYDAANRKCGLTQPENTHKEEDKYGILEHDKEVSQWREE